MQFMTIYAIKREYILNCLPWQRFVLSDCF